MQIKEINVSRSVCFNIGQQYSNEVLVIHFKGLPDLPNKYIYVKIDNYEKEVPLVGDLYVVSRPLTTYSGEVKAQIIARDPGNTPIALTPNFKMMITPSNYSGIGEDENYPDDPNIKNYYVKIDGKIQSMDELIALVQSKLDNGEFVGAQGPKGEKGEPGDVTEEYRNLASQIAQNATNAQASATNAQTSASNAQKALDDTKKFANQTKEELNQIKTDTSGLKDEANTSAVNAKASEDKAKEYADNLKESTDAISQNTKAISELADKKITKFYASNQGETHITDSDNGKIQDMMIYGKSSQDGTPTPNSPVEIKSVVNPKVKVTGENLWSGENTENYWMGDNTTFNDSCISSDYIYVKGAQTIYMGYSYDWHLGFSCYDEKKEKIAFNYQSLNDTETNTEIDYKIISSHKIPQNTYYIKAMYNKKEKKPYVSIAKGEYKPYIEEKASIVAVLNAIPTSSNGNITINGQQYISDYIDIKNKKMIQNVYCGKFKDLSYFVDKSSDQNWYDSSVSNSYEIKEIKYNGIFMSGNHKKIFCSKLKSYEFGEIYENNVENGILGDQDYIVINLSKALGIDSVEKFQAWANEIDIAIPLSQPIVKELTDEEISKFQTLKSLYPVTNISVNSEQLDGYAVFNYPISLANGWNYVKQQLNDNRDYIYDMDLQSAEAYVNSEYAVTLTELEV